MTDYVPRLQRLSKKMYDSFVSSDDEGLLQCSHDLKSLGAMFGMKDGPYLARDRECAACTAAHRKPSRSMIN